MFVTIRFDLPEDESELQAAIEGMDHLSKIRDFKEYLRNMVKYGHCYESVDEMLNSVYKNYCDVMVDYV